MLLIDVDLVNFEIILHIIAPFPLQTTIFVFWKFHKPYITSSDQLCSFQFFLSSTSSSSSSSSCPCLFITHWQIENLNTTINPSLPNTIPIHSPWKPYQKWFKSIPQTNNFCYLEWWSNDVLSFHIFCCSFFVVIVCICSMFLIATNYIQFCLYHFSRDDMCHFTGCIQYRLSSTILHLSV